MNASSFQNCSTSEDCSTPFEECFLLESGSEFVSPEGWGNGECRCNVFWGYGESAEGCTDLNWNGLYLILTSAIVLLINVATFAFCLYAFWTFWAMPRFKFSPTFMTLLFTLGSSAGTALFASVYTFAPLAVKYDPGDKMRYRHTLAYSATLSGTLVICGLLQQSLVWREIVDNAKHMRFSNKKSQGVSKVVNITAFSFAAVVIFFSIGLDNFDLATLTVLIFLIAITTWYWVFGRSLKIILQKSVANLKKGENNEALAKAKERRMDVDHTLKNISIGSGVFIFGSALYISVPGANTYEGQAKFLRVFATSLLYFGATHLVATSAIYTWNCSKRAFKKVQAKKRRESRIRKDSRSSMTVMPEQLLETLRKGETPPPVPMRTLNPTTAGAGENYIAQEQATPLAPEKGASDSESSIQTLEL
jgi:hypothetical protein